MLAYRWQQRCMRCVISYRSLEIVNSMKMSEGVEWALHCCLTLAWVGNDGPVPTSRLAAAFELPSHYLNKFLQSLVRAGIFTSSAGAKGGLSTREGSRGDLPAGCRDGHRGRRVGIPVHRNQAAWRGMSCQAKRLRASLWNRRRHAASRDRMEKGTGRADHCRSDKGISAIREPANEAMVCGLFKLAAGKEGAPSFFGSLI